MGRKSLCGKIRGGMVYMKVAVYATIGANDIDGVSALRRVV